MNQKYLKNLIRVALAEDQAASDITTRSLISVRQRSTARLFVKEEAVLSGVSIAQKVFRHLDKSVTFTGVRKDGAKLKAGAVVFRVEGRTRTLLSAERTALNFLGYLSGIATHTHHYVQAIKPSKAKILDTRKTTPTLRLLEKYAVTCGGGVNHRMDLASEVMIKDNHREVCQPEITIGESIARVRSGTRKKVVVEVDTLDQLAEALLACPDVILLDNMPPKMMTQAVAMRNRLHKKTQLEASGGISVRAVGAIARTGVDRISVGALTHSSRSMDFSMEIT